MSAGASSSAGKPSRMSAHCVGVPLPFGPGGTRFANRGG